MPSQPLNELYKKQSIAPWPQSLVPEICRGVAVLERLGEIRFGELRPTSHWCLCSR